MPFALFAELGRRNALCGLEQPVEGGHGVESQFVDQGLDGCFVIRVGENPDGGIDPE